MRRKQINLHQWDFGLVGSHDPGENACEIADDVGTLCDMRYLHFIADLFANQDPEPTENTRSKIVNNYQPLASPSG